uniref:GHMP kinase N-terminal domain-containing protein n=1 Tax=Romanomermis culicivorax TaxID=13658 RepID=A0A915IIE5_ROMCU
MWLMHNGVEVCIDKNKFYGIPDIGASDGFPPSLEVVVPVARRLSGTCDDQTGVQHLAVLAFWYLLVGVAHFKRNLPAVKVTVRFKLPSCVGLGSSGAYCVCIAAALLEVAGLIPKPNINIDIDDCSTWPENHLDIIRKWAASAESLIHGRASGLDAAVCTYEIESFLEVYLQETQGLFQSTLSSLKSTTIDYHLIYPYLANLRQACWQGSSQKCQFYETEKCQKNFPQVVENIFEAVDAISVEAIELLTKCVADNRKVCSEDEHHALQ